MKHWRLYALSIPAVWAPLIVLALVWLPVYSHYHAAVPGNLEQSALTDMRSSPDDDVLRELGGSLHAPLDDIAGIDEALSNGRLELPRLEPIAVSASFRPADLLKGSPEMQLQLASLVIADLKLQAYQRSEDTQSLAEALSYALDFVRFENRQILPYGLMWNDHAIANRVMVYGRLWWLARRSPELLSEAAASELMQAVQRSVALLEKDSHYSYRTNHGLIQNLGIIHAALAFPALPGTQSRLEKAIRRIDEQLAFFISEDGVIREHSAGYQEFGLQLVGQLLRYMTLLGRAIPAAWFDRYDAALEVYRCLRRPDGSLPVYGDTFSDGNLLWTAETDLQGGVRRVPDEPTATNCSLMSPGGGLAVMAFPDTQDQTVINWLDFVSRAHKHADELGLTFWAHGQDWWRAGGYWPYDTEARSFGTGWAGSNAPHAHGEGTLTRRHSEPLWTRLDDDIQFVDLQRDSEDYRVRRQVVGLKQGSWLVLDFPVDRAGRVTQTVWTTSPTVLASEHEPGSYRLKAVGASSTLHLAIAGSDGHEARIYRGSVEPFAGWVADGGEVRPAPSIVTETSSGGWTAVLWKAGESESDCWQGLGQRDIRSPEAWSVVIRDCADAWQVSREGPVVRLRINAGEEALFDLQPADSGIRELQAAFASYNKVAAVTPTFRDFLPWRIKVTQWILALVVLQVPVLLIFAIRSLRKFSSSITAAATLGWFGLGAYLQWIYFV